VVVIAGDPGAGKSRLLYEFLWGLDPGSHLALETTCASYGRAMAYRPLVELFRRYFDLSEEIAPDEARRRVAARLGARGFEGEEPAFLLHHFLGLSVPAEFLLRVQGAMLRDRTNELLGTIVARESATRPVILVVENMQWVDASSEALLTSLAARVRAHPVLLILTARPPVSMAWLPPGTEILTLEGLAPDDLREMVRALCGSRAVAEPLFQRLLAGGDGNPLYVEEIVRQLQETGGIVVENGEARLRTAEVTVPATIRDIIAARVDRLAESPKQTLQIASVVGPRFGVTLISHLRETERDHVAADLKDLHAVDFVFPSAHDSEPMYSFKHALTQEVVYTSLLERRRRLFHAAAGRSLEELYAGRLEDVLELLAHHFERSGEDDKAVDYAILAAEKAQRNWANTEALVLFEAALKRLGAMPDSHENRLRRIDAVVKQAEVKFALGRHAEQVQALEAIHDLVDAVAEPSRRAAWYYWAGFLHSLTGGRVDTPIAYCRQAQAIAAGAGLDELRAFAECALAHVLLVAGDLRGAMAAGARALATFEAQGNVWWACRTLWALSPVANALGAWTRGLEYCQRALEHGQAVDDLRLKVVGWWRTGSTHIQQGDAAAGLRCCEEALALTPIAFDAAMVRAVRGYGLVKVGQRDSGTRELEGAVAWFERSNLTYTWSLFALWQAESYLQQGQRDEAKALLERILATSGENGYRHLEGVAERLLGAALQPADPEARAHLERGMEILEAMGALNEVAKALVTRAELLWTAGDAAGAQRSLERAETIFQALGTMDGPAAIDAVRGVLS
jgi:tetratricopeptide (TPR) repeat protein